MLKPRGSATFDSQTLQDGLNLSLVGMGTVFVALVALAIAIKLMAGLDAAFPGRDTQARAAAAIARSRTPAPAPAAPKAEEDTDARTAAAIGLALALAESEQPQSAGIPPRKASAANAGSWLQSGRSRHLQAGPVGRQGGRRI